MNILLAEDDLDDRAFFEKALEKVPVATHLVIVQDGVQLMRYLEQDLVRLPDVLFLDLSMPGKNGFECLMEIKENDNLKGIPVIIFTLSFGRSSDYEQNLIDALKKFGSLEYIRKPSDIGELIRIIHTTLLGLSKTSIHKA